jgi:hypothetical protein
MKRLAMILGIFTLLLVSLSNAQQRWQRAYGGTDYDWGMSVQQAFDGGYIISGSTMSFPPQNWDAYLIRTNTYGDTLWTRVFGGSDIDAGNAVQQTRDSAFILAGVTYSPNAGVYLLKVNLQGDTLWTRTWATGSFNAGAVEVQQTLDRGYIITGWNGNRLLLMKTDASGDTLWTRTYGGNQSATGYFVRQTSDSGYIVVGEILWAKKTGAPGVGTIEDRHERVLQASGHRLLNRRGQRLIPGGVPAQRDVYLIKTNASGDSLWSKSIGGTSDDFGECVHQTSDGGYIIVGRTASYGAGSDDVYLVKTNSAGDTLWTKTYGGISWDMGYSLDLTPDGGFILVGTTSSFGDTSQLYLLKTDAQGNLRWAKTLGGLGQEWGYSVGVTSDGGYILTGSTNSFGAGLDDVFLVKTDSLGNVGAEEQGRSSTINRFPFSVRPNPFVSFATLPGHEAERFSLYDVSGRKVGTYKGDRIGEGLAPGVYFLRSSDKKDKPLRIVKVR